MPNILEVVTNMTSKSPKVSQQMVLDRLQSVSNEASISTAFEYCADPNLSNDPLKASPRAWNGRSTTTPNLLAYFRTNALVTNDPLIAKDWKGIMVTAVNIDGDTGICGIVKSFGDGFATFQNMDGEKTIEYAFDKEGLLRDGQERTVWFCNLEKEPGGEYL